MHRGTVWHEFDRLRRHCGLDYDTLKRAARIHDLRHTFVLRTLVNWYQEDTDVEAQLPLLATSGRELELRVGAPHAVGDQLGLVGVDIRFGERVVERVADGPDRREHEVIVEHLGVVEAGVLRPASV